MSNIIYVTYISILMVNFILFFKESQKVSVKVVGNKNRYLIEKTF